MWIRIFVLICLLPSAVLAENLKTFVLTGATWSGPSIQTPHPQRAIRLKEDPLGRLDRILTDAEGETSDLNIVYSQNKCQFSFKSGIVPTEVEISWLPQGTNSYKIILDEINHSPQQVVDGTTYPAEDFKKSVKIALRIITPQQYSWAETRSGPRVTAYEGVVKYTCFSGQKLIFEAYYPGLSRRVSTIMDGHTSGNDDYERVIMVYSKKDGHVIGTQSWTHDSTEPNDKNTSWFNGGGIEYSGDSLASHDPLINVVNYYILSSYFYQDAWSYFGPSLFDIPIR